MSDDMLNHLYNKPEPAKPTASLPRRIAAMLGGRIGLWVLGTVVMAALNNTGLLARGFTAACALIGLMGNPDVRKKATDIFNAAESKAEQVAKVPPLVTATPPVAAAPIITPAANPPAPVVVATAVPPISDGHKPTFKEKFNDKFVDPAKKTVSENAQKLEHKADETKQELKETANNVAGRLEGKLQGAPVIAPPRDPGQQVSGVIGDVGKMASVGIEKTPYGPGARKAAIDAQQARLAPLREDYNIWWAQYGPNGYCPACRQIMNVHRGGKGAARCSNPRCNFQTNSAKVRSMGAPPMPPEPPAQFYAWKKAKDDAARRAEKAPEKAPDKTQ